MSKRVSILGIDKSSFSAIKHFRQTFKELLFPVHFDKGGGRVEKILWRCVIVLSQVEQGLEHAAAQPGGLSLREGRLGGKQRRGSLQQVDVLEHEAGVVVSRHLRV